ncbi:MAG: GntR family transcriptional regulator [Clostridia bacterium]|nr:GntR family transcriptional regulator [Clostridia bacterium]
MNIFLDYHSRTPIYEQIKEQIVLDISRGVLKKDDQLPSLRQLSAQLGLNINTVKRALSELEAQGVIYTIAGKGVFVSGDEQSQNVYLQQSIEAVKASLVNAKAMGADRKQIEHLINEIFKGAED